MKRILYINHYAGSPQLGMGYRTYYFAKEWINAGHEVLVVTASYSHLRQRQPEEVLEATNRNGSSQAWLQMIEGVPYLVLKTPAYQGNGAKRVVNMLAFVWYLLTVAKKEILQFKPDIVIASSTYTWDNWPAAFYAWKCKAKYIYELHDIWPLSPMELGRMKWWHPFIWSLQRAENFACRKADKIISILPGTKDHLVEHGMRPEHFTHIPNGIMLEEWDARFAVPTEVLKSIEAYRKGKCFLLGYVGGHGLSNALDTFVEASSDERVKDVGFVCVGKGPEKERLIQKARQEQRDVLFLDAVPKKCVPELLKLFDVLYLGWNKSPLYRFGVSPNKIYDYMMAGVPILHAVDAYNDPVKEAGCGLSVQPEDSGALCEGVRKLMGISVCDRVQMGRKGTDYILKNHVISELARRFLDTILD
jgi:glycosyltransferase involved in cell wall biosynthesis